MQLDDVVSSLTTGPRVEEAMSVEILRNSFISLSYHFSKTRSRLRSVRWLDRCIATHKASGRTDRQNLFAIVQGGLDPALRDKCLDEMVQRKESIPGYAVGGLSGGEEKDYFWKMYVFHLWMTF